MNKRKENKKTALFEIFLLIISIFAFAYFIGEEFQIVSADTSAAIGAAMAERLASNLAEMEARALADPLISTIGVPAGAEVPATLPGGIAEMGGGVPPGIPGATTPGGLPADVSTGLPPAAEPTNYWTAFKDAIKSSLWEMLINAAIAASFYLIFKFSGIIDDPIYAEQMAIVTSVSYAIGSGTVLLINIIVKTFATGLAFGPALLLEVIVGLVAALAGGILCVFGFVGCTTIKAVTFTCFPWKPVSRGEDCEECNKGQFGCTRYKCESLGASCELLNAGTKYEVCEWADRNDMTPPIIEAWEDALTEGYKYIPITTEAGDRGVEIVREGADKCLPPYTRLDYGVSLDELAQCKADKERKDSYKEMDILLTLFGNKHIYGYNHSIFSIHDEVEETEGGVEFSGGGKFEVYVNCENKNGISGDNFVFKYCVTAGPDLTAPDIKLTNPLNKWPIAQGTIKEDVTIYIDKPVDCKWSHEDESYTNMPYEMDCSPTAGIYGYFPCTATLDGLKDDTENKFYFNCESYPLKEGTDKESERMVRAKNYEYILVGTRQLVIDSVSPVSGTIIKDSTLNVHVTLTAETSAGYKDGRAFCSYKDMRRTDNPYILFANTDSHQSTQELWLPRGVYDYTIKCRDLGGNEDTETTKFTIETDFTPPSVTRAYKEGNSLKIVTNEEATCVYDTTSCSYDFEEGIGMTSSDGISHFTDWKTDSNFYIKCMDEYEMKPASGLCSITVRPSDY